MKTFLLIRDNRLEYKIEVTEKSKDITHFILKYNDKIVLEASDFGDGVNVGINQTKGFLQLEYDTAEELSLLVRFITLYTKGEINKQWMFDIIDMSKLDKI